MAKEQKVKRLAGVKLAEHASKTVNAWATLTGKSINYTASWCIERFADVMIDPRRLIPIKAELEAMAAVQCAQQQSELRLRDAKGKLFKAKQARLL